MALTRLGKNKDAWQVLQGIVDDSDAPSMAVLLAARVLEDLGRYEDAVAMLKRFLEREPDATDVRQHMVELQNRLGAGDGQ